MDTKIPRFMLVAAASGSGKTTITCSLLKAYMNKNFKVSAFKSGPDYIDPMFHSKVLGAHSRNLDLFMLGKETTKYLLAKNSKDKDLAILEGVMGFYDGIGTTTEGSAYEVAKVTKTPVILCVNAKGAALSIAAIIKGFVDFRKDSNIKGVILNNTSLMTYMYYKETIEKETGIPLVGFLPNLPECSLESRHLGLITAEEITGLKQIVNTLSEASEKNLDLEAIYEIAKSAPSLECVDFTPKPLGEVTIGVAKDKVFCFYYEDALELLRELGATIINFSPLMDKKLPQCDGIILGGGYPELYAETLSKNTSLKNELKEKLIGGLPCFAECGGFMYLLEKFKGAENEYDFVGAIKGESHMTNRLTRFGYVSITANEDNMLCKRGQRINAHEFHYSDSNNNGESFSIKKASGKGAWQGCHGTETIYAGYPHMHLWGNIEFAKNFIKACIKYKNS